ncbi:U1 small nuclear ribonucleoprotein C [Malania oleifera]|uniref:U1 small nuclear ribonucleoprotein C n=1 Tax=Malania oleifera TaxID=397392 RepID=UPI0025AEBBF1|nr:U1 small nuclear ribonucleoprotein C [Malania oleifera]
MPRYYCDYCDTYLTHDSPSVRKQHNAGYKHKANVRTYYQQFEEQQTQSLIDQRIKEHLGQAAAFQQVGAAYNQHLASMPGNPQRPRLPILPAPGMHIPGAAPGPLVPGIRPPVLPRPMPAPGYGSAPMMMPPNVGPPGAPSLPMQLNGLPRPPTVNVPTAAPSGVATPTSNGNPSTITQPMYQAIPTAPGSSNAPSAATSADGFAYAQAPEASH